MDGSYISKTVNIFVQSIIPEAVMVCKTETSLGINNLKKECTVKHVS